MAEKPRRLLAFWGVLILLGGLLAGCARQADQAATPELAMAPLHSMHAEVQRAPVAVQEAYQFAFANPDVLQTLPCYCGCAPLGHKSNYDCYVAGAEASGELVYDPHALGCQICVDITQDTMRLLREGRSLGAVQKHVDLTYARYGPSNMP